MNKILRNSLLTSSIVAILGLTGCAGGTRTHDTEGFNLSQLETIVKVNETTYSDLRKLFRKPTLIGTTANDERVVVYAFRGRDTFYTGMEGLTVSLLTLGSVAAAFPETVKIAYFVLDKDDKVVAIKKNGYAYLIKDKGNSYKWNECELTLTDAEVNSDAYFSGRLDLCTRFKNEVAQRKGIDPKDVDDDEEFFYCDAKCHAQRGFNKLFGKFKVLQTEFFKEDADGSRADETAILHNPIRKMEPLEN